VRVIMLLRLPVRRGNWPGLKLEAEQFSRRIALIFEKTLL
jgi:hypothetical protein